MCASCGAATFDGADAHARNCKDFVAPSVRRRAVRAFETDFSIDVDFDDDGNVTLVGIGA